MTAVVALAGWNVSQSGSEMAMSDVTLNGIEALAVELDDVIVTCTPPSTTGGLCHEAYGCNGHPWCGCRYTGSQSDVCYYG
ncbi:MAG: hypothetical protein LBK58_10955 [Prevotellaceae bacterium]|nr:hypothetical protein [Prevotellaceae bacterium]